METFITGGCLCGAVRYRIGASPGGSIDPSMLPATYCHCTMCRKATGGAYAALLAIPRNAVTWTAEQPSIYRSSPIASRGFCNKCGSPLFYDGDTEKTLAVTVGSLDDPSVVRPQHHYGIESKLHWVDAGRSLPGRHTEERFEGQP
jgi:hypothetical protein